MSICGFDMKISGKVPVREAHFKIKKWNTIFTWLICKFKIRVTSIKFFKKWIKFLLSMGPNKKHIIYISKPYQRFHFLSLKKTSFYFAHKYAGVRRGELSSYCRSRNLPLNFTVKFEIVVLKNKLCHFNQIFCWNFFISTIIKGFL